jgi:uncharacterized protein YjiK
LLPSQFFVETIVDKEVRLMPDDSLGFVVIRTKCGKTFIGTRCFFMAFWEESSTNNAFSDPKSSVALAHLLCETGLIDCHRLEHGHPQKKEDLAKTNGARRERRKIKLQPSHLQSDPSRAVSDLTWGQKQNTTASFFSATNSNVHYMSLSKTGVLIEWTNKFLLEC